MLAGFDLPRHRPRLLLIEDHLLDLQTHRAITRVGYRLVKRTGLNNWYIPGDAPFDMSTPGERLALRRKLYLGTMFRRPRRALRRLLGR